MGLIHHVGRGISITHSGRAINSIYPYAIAVGAGKCNNRI